MSPFETFDFGATSADGLVAKSDIFFSKGTELVSLMISSIMTMMATAILLAFVRKVVGEWVITLNFLFLIKVSILSSIDTN